MPSCIPFLSALLLPMPLGAPGEGLAPQAAAASADDWTITWKWKDGIRFETGNGKVKGKMGGRIQWDTSFLSLDDGLEGAGFDDSDGTEFRRARLSLDLEFAEGIYSRAEYDFVALETAIKDLYIGKRDLVGSADLQVGHFKEPLSIGQLTSDSFTTFVERALPDVYAPSRNNGAMLQGSLSDDALTWAVGVFKETDDGGVNAEDGGFAGTGRISASPIYEDEGKTLVHVGVGYTQRDVSELRYRQRPEVHLSDRLIDTGTLAAEDVGVGNAELAGVFGPMHATAEFFTSAADGADGADDFDSSGFYVETGYFLTGESRPYRRPNGIFDRVLPQENYGADGLGAFEIAARYSTLDLTDGAIAGGEEDNITVAFNWYLNPNMRAGINYVTGTVDLGGALDSEDVQALLTRIEINW